MTLPANIVRSSTYLVLMGPNNHALMTDLAFDQELATRRDQAVMRLGHHDVCGGAVLLQRVSSSHNAVRCEQCGWRIEVPDVFKIFGGLQKHLEDQARKI